MIGLGYSGLSAAALIASNNIHVYYKYWELMWRNILSLIDLTDKWLGQSLTLIND